MKSAVIVSTLLSSAIAASAFGALKYQGFNYVSLNNTTDLGSAKSDQELFKIEQLGSNSVAIDIYDFQDTTTSTTIAANPNRYSPTTAALQHAIDQIHSLGMNIIFKPMIDLNDGNWRGFINPAAGDVNAWFTSYSNFINTYADLAEQNKSKGVTLFSVGCEFNGMEQYAANWTSLINGVRSRYSGKLTYSANWSSTTIDNTQKGGYKNVSWWNQLDEIGIDAYFPLTGKNNPTETELQNGWAQTAFDIQTWRANAGLTQNVIFTEGGYQATDGSNQSPAGASGTTPDVQEQADSYQALLTIMSKRPWFDGVDFWAWSPNSDQTDLTRGFTPDNKPATLNVIKSFFLPEPTTMVLATAFGLIALRRRIRQ